MSRKKETHPLEERFEDIARSIVKIISDIPYEEIFDGQRGQKPNHIMWIKTCTIYALNVCLLFQKELISKHTGVTRFAITATVQKFEDYREIPVLDAAITVIERQVREKIIKDYSYDYLDLATTTAISCDGDSDDEDITDND